VPRPVARNRSARSGMPGCCPRPWEPASCRPPQLRKQLWLWLEAVVAWLVTECVWEVADAIPACWPQHPHLVHEISVLADLPRRAGHAFTSDAARLAISWSSVPKCCLPPRRSVECLDPPPVLDKAGDVLERRLSWPPSLSHLHQGFTAPPALSLLAPLGAGL
jgi:hypothetical protein